MTLTPRQQLSLFIVLAFIIDYLPIINLPFLWSETFFHEISHGLAALLTGGTIHNITLNFNGSGVCTTSGGTRFLIAFSGYAGSALWGLLIYSIASKAYGRHYGDHAGAYIIAMGAQYIDHHHFAGFIADVRHTTV